MDGLNLEALANLGDFISAIVVVVSLVYLASQVRQNTESMRTENYARVLERVANMQARLGADAVFSELIARGAADPARLTAGERVQFTWTFYEMFGAFEFMFHQAGSNALPMEVWQRWSETLSWWISLPGVKAWWLSRPAPFSASFTGFVDAKLQQGPADTDASLRWGAFLRTGVPPEAVPIVKEA
jgi:hypothetical protein